MSDAPAAASATTVAEWVAQVEPVPPPALAQRLLEMIASDGTRPVDQVPEVCLDAAERALASMLETGSTSRDSALDLLTVDALVTYAFQAAADAPERIEARAMRAMQRIAALPDAIITGRGESPVRV